jgi:hypothetical protein
MVPIGSLERQTTDGELLLGDNWCNHNVIESLITLAMRNDYAKR